MLNLAVKYFLEVAQTGSLSAASASLHVAISAISRQISRLEQEVGAPLFDRASRGMSLTDAGRIMLAHARRTSLESDATLNAIAALQGSPGNLIRIACAQGLANDLIPACAAHFRRRFPDTRFDLWVGQSGTASRRVAEGDSDIAMTFSMEPAQGIVVRHANQSRVLAVMSRHHPLAAEASLSIAQIRQYPLALSGPGTVTRTMFDQSLGMAGTYVEPSFTSNHAGALHAYVRESESILLGGYVSMVTVLAMNDLVAVRLRDPEMAFRSLQIQVMAGRLLPGRTEAFITCLAQEMARIHDQEIARLGE